MFKSLEVVRKVEDLQKSLSRKDSAKYVLLSMIGLCWMFYEYVSSVDVKLTDVLMIAVIGVLYLLNEKQGHAFVVSLHHIITQAEKAGETILSLQNVLVNLNDKVKKDNDFKKEISVYKDDINSQLNDFRAIISKLLSSLQGEK